MEMRTIFRKSLKNIQDEILVMGSMVTEDIAQCIEALKNRDLRLASRLIENDALINKKRFDIEERCVELINTQQPVATI